MKKILSVLVAICMLLSVIPMAYATDEGIEGTPDAGVVDEVVDDVNEEELADPSIEADEETMPVFSVKEAFGYLKTMDFDGLVSYIGKFLNLETLKYAIDNALKMLGGLDISDFLDGSILEGVFGSFTDVCATIADVLVELLAMVGIDFNEIVDFINNDKFLSFIASIYAYGGVGTPEEPTTEEEVIVTEPTTEEPTTEEVIEVPETGVADMGIAAFAALSVAGAAAYVLTKKKAA